MDNPYKVLSEDDILFLEENGIHVPDRDLTDDEADDFAWSIIKDLNEEDTERIIDSMYFYSLEHDQD